MNVLEDIWGIRDSHQLLHYQYAIISGALLSSADGQLACSGEWNQRQACISLWENLKCKPADTRRQVEELSCCLGAELPRRTISQALGMLRAAPQSNHGLLPPPPAETCEDYEL